MKKRGLSIIVLMCSISFLAYSQPITKKSDLNPEYIKYLQEKEDGISDRYTPDGYRLNYIPNPVKLNFKNRSKQGILKSTAAFPDRFDLRDSSLVTIPKDQGGGEYGGNCVAFATMGALESNWLKMGDTEYNLSEQNQAACYGFKWAYGDGATQHMPCAYLSRFSGPVLESEDSYDINIQDCNSSFDPVYYVPEVRWLPKDIDLIKRIVMNYGGLPVSVHILYEKFNDEDDTYYYDGDNPANHAFLLIGWDDEKQTAGGIGAWIIKNSWSDTWAENGYVYVSYNDTKIMDDITFYPYRWRTDEVDNLYYYDELGVIYSIGWATTATNYDYANALIKFRSTTNQLIDRIGTYILSEGAILNIEVYREFDGKNLSENIASLENIYIEHPGYHTFSLPFEISGDFYIKIRYYTPGNDAPIPVEGYQQGDGEEWADPVLDNNVCWYSINDTIWTLMDTLTEPANLCIRAYGRNTDKTSATIVSDKSISCLNSDVEFAAVTTGDPSSFEWDFGAGAEPATASTEGPHMVSYSTKGTKHIKLIVSGTGGSDTTIFHNAVEIVDFLNLYLERDTFETPSRLEVDLKAYGADTYAWSPADNLNKTEGNIVTLNTQETGELRYTVTGTQGDCSAQKTVTVISKPRPDNDDVCDAMFIKPGGWIGYFSNTDATVQENEPAPGSGLNPGTCNTPSDPKPVSFLLIPRDWITSSPSGRQKAVRISWEALLYW